MIRLFISDIDGCLARPFEAYQLEHWRELAGVVAQGTTEENHWPQVTVCSGRPLPYVEAVSQALDLQVSALFEAGGGRFYLPDGTVTWNPNFTDEMAAAMKEIRKWLVEKCISGTKLDLDYSKRTQAGVIGPDTPAIERLYPQVQDYVERQYTDLRVFSTSISIDVVPDTITKRQALDWLSEETDISLKEMAFIGDTGGDLDALEAVGHSFAPQNAEPAVKKRVAHVTDGSDITGVLQALNWCAQHNGVCV
jgi:HAD superfamily hydrolase (TIGR01484 family)